MSTPDQSRAYLLTLPGDKRRFRIVLLPSGGTSIERDAGPDAMGEPSWVYHDPHQLDHSGLEHTAYEWARAVAEAVERGASVERADQSSPGPIAVEIGADRWLTIVGHADGFWISDAGLQFVRGDPESAPVEPDGQGRLTRGQLAQLERHFAGVGVCLEAHPDVTPEEIARIQAEDGASS